MLNLPPHNPSQWKYILAILELRRFINIEMAVRCTLPVSPHRCQLVSPKLSGPFICLPALRHGVSTVENLGVQAEVFSYIWIAPVLRTTHQSTSVFDFQLSQHIGTYKCQQIDRMNHVKLVSEHRGMGSRIEAWKVFTDFRLLLPHSME